MRGPCCVYKNGLFCALLSIFYVCRLRTSDFLTNQLIEPNTKFWN